MRRDVCFQPNLIMWFRRQREYRDEDVKNQVEIEVKNGSENYCFVPRNSHKEDKLADKFETGHMDEAAQEALNRLDRDPLAERGRATARTTARATARTRASKSSSVRRMQSSSSTRGTQDSRSQEFQTVQTEKEVRDEESRKRKTKRLSAA